LTPDHTNLSQSFIETYRNVLDPDGDNALDLSGGFHDAGDHVKFGLPQSYSASTLGWGFYTFREAFDHAGASEHMLDILRTFSDYFLRSTFMDSQGEVVAFSYMVGEGSSDHTYWGPPELQDGSLIPRPADFATAQTPGSDQAAGAAAALTIMSLNTQAEDPAYAAECLTTAKALYRFAQTYRGLGAGDGFYTSSYDEDELSWAAVWLYEATNDIQYIRDIDATDDGVYTGYMKRIISTTANTWQNIWVHSWDTVWGGVFTKLATLFPDRTDFDYFARWNLEYWSGGSVPHEDSNDGNYLTPTPAGFAVRSTWGSARYNAAAQLCALVYAKYTGRRDFVDNWVRGQMNYILGQNPFGYSLLVGYPTPEASAQHPHHRAAHGSQTNSMVDPPEHRHVLWGALVGGPDNADHHNDVTTDFVYNEVAIDYNAGLVGALAGLVSYYGENQVPVPDFPPPEDPVEAFFMEARLEQENTERTQVTLVLHNESTQPPHFESELSARYFFDISELLDAGQTIDDVRFEIYYDEHGTRFGTPTNVTGPMLWSGPNTYYLEFDWSSGELYGTRELQFGLIAAQDSAWQSHWDPSNDWSRQGLQNTNTLTDLVPVYFHGEIVYGQEPPL
jgi:hypothetical protein